MLSPIARQQAGTEAWDRDEDTGQTLGGDGVVEMSLWINAEVLCSFIVTWMWQLSCMAVAWPHSPA